MLSNPKVGDVVYTEYGTRFEICEIFMPRHGNERVIRVIGDRGHGMFFVDELFSDAHADTQGWDVQVSSSGSRTITANWKAIERMGDSPLLSEIRRIVAASPTSMCHTLAFTFNAHNEFASIDFSGQWSDGVRAYSDNLYESFPGDVRVLACMALKAARHMALAEVGDEQDRHGSNAAVLRVQQGQRPYG